MLLIMLFQKTFTDNILNTYPWISGMDTAKVYIIDMKYHAYHKDMQNIWNQELLMLQSL